MCFRLHGPTKPSRYMQVFFFCNIFSSAVPPGSGTFQLPTRPSSSAVSASTLRGGGDLRNASVTFSLFWHEASLG